MKISIIVPVYNVSSYVIQCLDSIVSQGYDELECIVVDDCGTDDSVSKVEHWIDEYSGNISFRILHNESNKGLSLSRNAGLKEATGDYVMFLDSDDYLIEGALPKVIEAIGDATPDIVRTNYVNYIEKDDVYKDVVSSKHVAPFCGEGKTFLLQFHDCSYNYVWLNLYRRAFLVENNLTFIDMLYEDMPFTLESYYLASSVQYLQMQLVTYRTRLGSITNANCNSNFMACMVNIYETCLALMRKHGMGDEYITVIRASFYWFRVSIWQFIHHKNVTDEEIKLYLRIMSKPLNEIYAHFGIVEYFESILWSGRIGFYYIKFRRFLTFRKF